MKDFIMLAQEDTSTQSTTEGAPAEQTGTTAQGDPAANNATPGEQQPTGPGIWLPLVMCAVIMYFFMFRGPKKRQQKQKQMLSNIKKNDRVRTIGGIIGTVVDLRDDEIVIKIDESNNTKMRVIRSAVSTVITDEEQEKK